jgi:hypothetical protein
MRHFKAFALASLIILGSGLVLALPASADENSISSREPSRLFAMGEQGVVLLAINVKKQSTEIVGLTGAPLPSLALAIIPDGRAAYTIAQTMDPAQAHLAKIDLATGAETLAGAHALGQNLFIMGMTFSPDGTLYAAGDFTLGSPTFNSLYTIDLTTGLATRIGSFGVGSTNKDFIMSFSFDPNGNLYGASQAAIYRIDRTTAAATKVVNINITGRTGPSRVMGIAFDKKGKLLASDFIDLPQGSTIYRVDLETGLFTPLFRTGIAFVHNIAFKPEPGCGNGNHNDLDQCNS